LLRQEIIPICDVQACGDREQRRRHNCVSVPIGNQDGVDSLYRFFQLAQLLVKRLARRLDLFIGRSPRIASTAVKVRSTDWKIPDACWERIFSDVASSSSARATAF